jgi:hypothetical protein
MRRVCVDIDAILSADELRACARDAWPADAPVVVLANHLCGSALDSSVELFAADAMLRGFCAATCCHDKCTWAAYCNKPFFASLGLDELDFRQIAAWAALARRRNKPSAERPRVREVARQVGIDADSCELLGGASRLIIDTGRRLRLEAHGLRTGLRCHVPFEITADNVMIAASRPPWPEAVTVSLSASLPVAPPVSVSPSTGPGGLGAS